MLHYYYLRGYRITALPQVSNLLTGVRLPLPAQPNKNAHRKMGVFVWPVKEESNAGAEFFSRKIL